jgi:ornithine cyclodeaminase
VDVLVLDGAAVARLLPIGACIEVMAAAFRALARGEAQVPPRAALLPPAGGALAWMPAWLGGESVMGIKTITVFGRNRGTPYPSHQGAVLLFDCAHGRPLAIVDAAAVTEIRTAAVSALATRLLANPGAGDLALFGSGTQASAHLAAMAAVRTLRRVRVWSRDPAHARRFAEAESARHGLPVEVAADGAAAAEGADLICTATAARHAVLRGAWIAPGAHVNAVGASVPPFRELDSAVASGARIVVETRAAALAEADDLRVPLREGAIAAADVAELGELLEGRAAGRGSPDGVTLFKSVGLGIEDVAAAHHAHLRALEAGEGVRVPFGLPRGI